MIPFAPSVYVWPPGDGSYMKLIWKEPTPKYPSGFHVLGTRLHPIGDFDNPGASLPDEPLRIYKTLHGWRVFFTGRYNVDPASMFDELVAMGGDPLYSKMGRERGYFSCRIEPKSGPVSGRSCVAKLVDQIGTNLPEWNDLILYHDSRTNALDPDGILV